MTMWRIDEAGEKHIPVDDFKAHIERTLEWLTAEMTRLGIDIPTKEEIRDLVAREEETNT